MSLTHAVFALCNLYSRAFAIFATATFTVLFSLNMLLMCVMMHDGDVMNDQRSQLEPEVSLPTSQPQSNLRDPTLSSSSKFGLPDADRDEGVPACQGRRAGRDYATVVQHLAAQGAIGRAQGSVQEPDGPLLGRTA